MKDALGETEALGLLDAGDGLALFALPPPDHESLDEAFFERRNPIAEQHDLTSC